jgi:hypothetical protein
MPGVYRTRQQLLGGRTVLMGLFINSLIEIWDVLTEPQRRKREDARIDALCLAMERQGYTITQVVAGVPVKWFCYCPREVWRWSASERMAHVFHDYSAAERAVENCSVSYKSSYQIIKRQ